MTPTTAPSSAPIPAPGDGLTAEVLRRGIQRGKDLYVRHEVNDNPGLPGEMLCSRTIATLFGELRECGWTRSVTSGVAVLEHKAHRELLVVLMGDQRTGTSEQPKTANGRGPVTKDRIRRNLERLGKAEPDGGLFPPMSGPDLGATRCRVVLLTVDEDDGEIRGEVSTPIAMSGKKKTGGRIYEWAERSLFTSVELVDPHDLTYIEEQEEADSAEDERHVPHVRRKAR